RREQLHREAVHAQRSEGKDRSTPTHRVGELTMSNRAAEELLFDSEATLRLVDNVLDELQVMEAEVSRSEDRVRTLSVQIGRAHAGIADLPGILLRAHDEIHAVLGNLRQSRDVLERTTVERIHQ